MSDPWTGMLEQGAPSRAELAANADRVAGADKGRA